MTHSANYFQKSRRAHRGPARRIGRTLALVLPVMLVLSGTLAVTSVNWSGDTSDSMLTASADDLSKPRTSRAPQDILRDKLLLELQEKDPGVALTHLQREVDRHPSLAEHCMSIARALGRAAVQAYGPTRAQSYARPVCDTSYATGVATHQNR
ncbi:hypothetical protein DCW30_22265 [Streptomyces alfalfae]|uniref:Uncharacterized protein n=1 Tax=Streptomyces alfalfae TaxID=1642299 RepID=A0A1P8TJ07_9ACTN|nr:MULTISPECIES: hypothetical protein [Streptomyces]AYA18032.1 hypothetical protein D3X13_18915 [Streptomyces fradiae]APY87613.1 hypothetical protein A7J05_19505 [Streptomyces alfalfae]KUL58335.1 hypothetical protein ADL30_10875 [Streptomyces sp. NRRL S-1521]QQC90053.1 hypothetical protein I8755_17750 [Streptomyces alfalfae]QUI32474.1 hypothetical protein H9W91_17610 [Streptomyces alfalfae]